jgi:hypothetical protein
MPTTGSPDRKEPPECIMMTVKGMSTTGGKNWNPGK